jgi:demethylmenaquinone methyltransferase/2-methoxy-6-polyprenyl-1,4-benzoquinol methylase
VSSPDPILSDQLDYYRARSGEYNEWFFREGRYDRGEDATSQWFSELREVERALAACAPFGNCLELACGTGLWTRHLVEHASKPLRPGRFRRDDFPLPAAPP